MLVETHKTVKYYQLPRHFWPDVSASIGNLGQKKPVWFFQFLSQHNGKKSVVGIACVIFVLLHFEEIAQC